MAIEISTIAQLQLIGNDPSYPIDGDYIITNDIDASETESWNSGAGFNPISQIGTPGFTGTLNGQWHRIYGLHINRPDESYVALFRLNYGTISHLFVDAEIAGNTAVSILCFANFGSIVRCGTSGNISAGSYAAGFVLATALSGRISDSYSTANVSASYNAAGFIYTITNTSSVTRCYSTGVVNCTSQAAGFNYVLDEARRLIRVTGTSRRAARHTATAAQARRHRR